MINIDDITIFLLVGGFGTRLKSVVNNVPKPMAPVCEKPFLDYQIENVRKFFPTNTIYLLTYYKSEIIERYYKDKPFIKIIKESSPLGTGGSVTNAINTLELIPTSKIIILNGDTFIQPDFKDIFNNLETDITIIGSYQKNCARYGTLTLQNNQIIDFCEKKENSTNSFINAGCYIFKNLNFFTKIKQKEFSLEEKLIEYLSNNGKISIYKYNGIFIDIGIPKDYEKMIQYIEDVTIYE